MHINHAFWKAARSSLAMACLVVLALTVVRLADSSCPSLERAQTVSKMEAIQSLVMEEVRLSGRFPTQLVDIVRGDSAGVQTNRIYEGLSTDGWGTPFDYRLVPSGFVIVSAGSDRRFGTKDDLLRSGGSNH